MDQLKTALTSLVTEMAGVVAEMSVVLHAERAALERYDSEALNLASSEKSAILARLDALDAERLLLLRSAGQDSQTGMAEIEGWAPMLEVLSIGRELNRENGEIVSQRLKQVRQALSMLNQLGSPHAAEAGVYSPKGMAPTRGGSSSLGKA